MHTTRKHQQNISSFALTLFHLKCKPSHKQFSVTAFLGKKWFVHTHYPLMDKRAKYHSIKCQICHPKVKTSSCNGYLNQIELQPQQKPDTQNGCTLKIQVIFHLFNYSVCLSEKCITILCCFLGFWHTLCFPTTVISPH